MDLFRTYFTNFTRTRSEHIKFPDMPVEQLPINWVSEGLEEAGDATIGTYRGKPVIAIKHAYGLVIISETLSRNQWRVYANTTVMDFLVKPIEADGSCIISEEMLRFILGNQTNLQNNFVVRTLHHPFN